MFSQPANDTIKISYVIALQISVHAFFQIEFVVENTKDGYVGIDDVMVYDGPCPDHGKTHSLLLVNPQSFFFS